MQQLMLQAEKQKNELMTTRLANLQSSFGLNNIKRAISCIFSRFPAL